MHQDSRPANHSAATLINVFEVPAQEVDAFVAQWRERAALMSTKPGFIAARLHRALSSRTRFQLVNVAHWESPEAHQAAVADAEFQQRISAVITDPQVPISANPALYRVAVEVSPSAATPATGQPTSSGTADGDGRAANANGVLQPN